MSAQRRQLSRPGLPESSETSCLPGWLQIDGVPARVSDAFHRAILLRTVATTTSPWHIDVLTCHVTRDGFRLGR
ncbi:hypothetical protein [Nocardia sp. NBC_00403]|uniref:hypothetical protein n=1 Tax=Nocardia sp. NBC_00403 TaxID=2975990 RepID=UPI002E1BB4E3